MMPNSFLVDHFILDSIATVKADLSCYKDTNFSNRVRLNSINAIIAMLSKIKHSRGKPGALNFDSRDDKGLSMLDYCLVAGLENIATELMLNGAQLLDADIFIANIERCFPDQQNHTPIVQDIKATIEKVSLSQFDRLEPQITGNLTTILQDHKFPALLLTLGLTCSALSVVAHGASSILLLSIGIPSMLSSIGSLQNSSNNKERVAMDLHRDLAAHEERVITRLLDMAMQKEAELKRDIVNQSIITREPAVNSHLLAAQNSELLFSANEVASAKTEIKRAGMPSPSFR